MPLSYVMSLRNSLKLRDLLRNSLELRDLLRNSLELCDFPLEIYWNCVISP